MSELTGLNPCNLSASMVACGRFGKHVLGGNSGGVSSVGCLDVNIVLGFGMGFVG